MEAQALQRDPSTRPASARGPVRRGGLLRHPRSRRPAPRRWRARKERYLAHLADSPFALWVSLADELDHSRALARDYRDQGEALRPRSGRDPDDVRWYYRALAERCSDLRPGRLADALCRSAAELEELTV